ncbi:MAG: preprotein translocase subunit SecE [Bacteroidales bacterium]|jgi:preprotein translocase subunit SecE
MSKIGMYFKDSYSELFHKVSWPTWSQLQNSAIIVMVASVIFAIVIFAMDITFRNLMEFLYKALY